MGPPSVPVAGEYEKAITRRASKRGCKTMAGDARDRVGSPRFCAFPDRIWRRSFVQFCWPWGTVIYLGNMASSSRYSVGNPEGGHHLFLGHYLAESWSVGWDDSPPFVWHRSLAGFASCRLAHPGLDLDSRVLRTCMPTPVLRTLYNMLPILLITHHSLFSVPLLS